MLRVNEYRFYELGQSLKALKSMTDDTPLDTAWWPLYTAKMSLSKMLRDPLPLKVCRPATERLLRAISGLIPSDINALIQGPSSPTATLGYAFSSVETALGELEPVLAAECDAMDTYVISKKGIYSTSELIADAAEALPPEVLGVLPAQAVNDIRAAGRCLAFDLDTACGFHLIRATETAIHQYFVAVTGTAPKRKDRNWGAYVRILNAHRKNDPNSKADPRLIALIDQIREHHRNVLMHPEESLSPNDALILFGVCQSAIAAFALGFKAISGGP